MMVTEDNARFTYK